MKNRSTEFKDFIFKISHPVSYDFTPDEREIIAENVAVNVKITTGESIDTADVRHLINDGSSDLEYYKAVGKIAHAWENAGFVREMQKMLAVIAEYHKLSRNTEGLRMYEAKDVNEYGRKRK
ncbi:hypothetical protein [Holdemanella porci]|uniref:hypothetical protein n=1 Tax=Holdemanella porci TaxID=2652276 RepID=UPI003AEF7E64